MCVCIHVYHIYPLYARSYSRHWEHGYVFLMKKGQVSFLTIFNNIFFQKSWLYIGCDSRNQERSSIGFICMYTSDIYQSYLTVFNERCKCMMKSYLSEQLVFII